MNWRKRCRAVAVVVLAINAAIAAGWAGSAYAQQGELSLPPAVPRNQKQGGAVLEVPRIPGRQSGETESIPQLAPQQGPELTVPSRQLARQPAGAGLDPGTEPPGESRGRGADRRVRTADQGAMAQRNRAEVGPRQARDHRARPQIDWG